MKTLSKTKIDWATHVWNPITGCKHRHAFCYAEKLFNARRTQWYGPGAKRVPWDYIWEHPERYLMCSPSGAFVFINSMGDPFFWGTEQILRVFRYVQANSQAKFLLLTHNPLFFYDNTHHLGSTSPLLDKIPPNIRMGLSLTNDIDFNYFIHQEAPIDFVSMEPFMLPWDGQGMDYFRYLHRNDFPVPFHYAIIGGQTPFTTQYHAQWEEDFLQAYEILYDLDAKGEINLLVKDNAAGFDGIEATVPPNSSSSQKKTILEGFWD